MRQRILKSLPLGRGDGGGDDERALLEALREADPRFAALDDSALQRCVDAVRAERGVRRAPERTIRHVLAYVAIPRGDARKVVEAMQEQRDLIVVPMYGGGAAALGAQLARGPGCGKRFDALHFVGHGEKHCHRGDAALEAAARIEQDLALRLPRVSCTSQI